MDSWTLMYYISGAGALTAQVEQDLQEIATVGSGDGVNLVCQYASRKPNTSTKRFRMLRGARDHEQSLDSAAPGTPATLLEFLNWSANQFPAQRFGLMILGHGSGWEPEDIVGPEASVEDFKTRYALDMINGREVSFLFRTTAKTVFEELLQQRAVLVHDITGHSLDSVELEQCLRTAGDFFGGRKLEFVGFDACLMGCIEVAVALQACVKFVVASSQLEPSRGWPHESVAALFRAAPDASTEDLLIQLPQIYVASYKFPVMDGLTLSVVDSSKLDGLIDVMAKLSAKMEGQVSGWKVPFLLTLEETLLYKMDLWDMGCLCDGLSRQEGSAWFRDELLAVRREIGNTLASFLSAGKPVDRATGLSLYVPGYQGTSPYYHQTRWAQRTGWGRVMQQWRPFRQN